jgi:hypothetical protein
MNATGTNTAHNVKVVATTASPISDGSVCRRLQGRLAHAQMPDDVLHFHDGVVDQHAHHQRQRPHAHEVERETEDVQPRMSG